MSLDDPVTAQLYTGIKQIILTAPRCPDGDGYIACASCLANAIATAINAPDGTPIATAIGDVPIFSPKDVQQLINAVVKIDRDECQHDECQRSRSGSVVLLPL